MGDLMEITTIPKQEYLFYKITSGSLRFQVKGPCNAGIGLVTFPGADILWFVIARDGFTTVTKNRIQYQSVPTPDILSTQRFSEFWLQWQDNMLCLGRDYVEDPFIAHQDKTCDLKYVTFGVYGHDECCVQWRFEMPPLHEPIRMNPVSDGTPQWIPADTQLPDGALIGGYEKEMLYIIRAKHQRSLTPGKFVPSHGAGYIPWGGRTHEKSQLEVLCGYDCVWLPCSDGKVPAGAVEGGYAESSGLETLYIGRAHYKECIIPGKVHPSHHVCYIPYKNIEVAVNVYEVLVAPRKTLQRSNAYLLCD